MDAAFDAALQDLEESRIVSVSVSGGADETLLKSISKPDTGNLPLEYAHFGAVEQLLRRLEEIDEEEYFPKVYDGYLRLLAMMLDSQKQKELIEKFRAARKNGTGSDYETERQRYWDELKRDSSYRRIGEIRKKLNEDTGDGTSLVEKEVKLWNSKNAVSERDRMKADFQVRMAARVYPNVWNRSIIESAFGSGDSLAYRSRGSSLTDRIVQGELTEYLPYVSALRVMVGARDCVRNGLKDAIENHIRLSEGYRLTPDGLQSLLKRLEPIYFVAEALRARERSVEQKLFGEEEAQTAGELWRTLVFLQTKKLNIEKVMDVQDRLLGILCDGEYLVAAGEFYKLETENPGILKKNARDLVWEFLGDEKRAILDAELQQRRERKEKRTSEKYDSYGDSTWTNSDGSLKVLLARARYARRLGVNVLYVTSDTVFDRLLEYCREGDQIFQASGKCLGYRLPDDKVDEFIERFGLKKVEDGASNPDSAIAVTPFNDESIGDLERRRLEKRYHDTSWVTPDGDLGVDFFMSTKNMGIYCSVRYAGENAVLSKVTLEDMVEQEKEKIRSHRNAVVQIESATKKMRTWKRYREDALMVYIRGEGTNKIIPYKNLERMIRDFGFIEKKK